MTAVSLVTYCYITLLSSAVIYTTSSLIVMKKVFAHMFSLETMAEFLFILLENRPRAVKNDVKKKAGSLRRKE